MATTERDVLEAKVLPELQAIASSMGVQGYFRLRKADLIGAIIAKARGEEYTPTTPSATRSRRAATTAKPASAAKEPAAASAPAEAAPAADVKNGTAASRREPAAAPEPPQPAATAAAGTGEGAAAIASTPAATPGEQAGPQAAEQPRPQAVKPAAPSGEQSAGRPGDERPPAGDQPAVQTAPAVEANRQDTTPPAASAAEPAAADQPRSEPAAERDETSPEAETPNRRRRRRARGSSDDDSSSNNNNNSEPLQGILSAVTSGVAPVNNRQAENGEAPAGAAEAAAGAAAVQAGGETTTQSDGQSGQRDQGRDSGDRGQRRDWGQGGRWDGGASSSSAGGGRRSRSRNRRNRNRLPGNDVAVADRPDFRDRSGVPDDRPEVSRKGILDIRSQDGYGFLRVNGYLPGPDDVYVPLSMIRRLGLRRGDEIEAQVKLPRDNSEKYAACSRVDKINDMEPDEARSRKDFKDLTPLYPEERLRLEHNPTEISTRIMDLMCPIGKGQRGLIVSPPKAGKTTVMKQIANAVSENNPEVHLILLLVGERPEEVTDMQRSTKAEVIYSTFDRPSEDHCQISELTIERAKRLVEYGKDVMILLDGITRLSRAYNLATPASGKILSGGVDSSALYPPKRFFGAARNIEDGGSLTILATALVDTGSRMDEVIFEEFKGTGNMEVRLDRKMSERRIFPALDIDASSTRKEELLLAPEELVVAWKLRRVLGALEPAQALEMVVDRMRASKTNAQFLQVIQRANMGN